MTYKSRDNRVIAIIPARGGSKGIPYKNISPLHGKPLITYTIEAALNANEVTDVIVSTDNKEIASVSTLYTRVRLHHRSSDLSKDDTPTSEVIINIIKEYELDGDIVLLQPTSPLRTTSMISEAYKIYSKNDSLSLISVCEEKHSSYKNFVMGENGLEPLFDEKSLSLPRQHLPSIYRQNGAIYILHSNTLLKHRAFFARPCSVYIMDETSSIDIDTPQDLHLAEHYLKK